MSVKFIKKIRDSKRLTRYGMAKAMGVMPQTVDFWEERSGGRAFILLSKLRQVSGLSWEELGKMLDDEFLQRKR